MVKLKTVGSREHFEKEFRLRESFELCRNVGKNLFVVEGYLIDEERKEGEGRTRASGTWRHLWRKDHRERNDMMYPGQSDEPVWQVGYIRLCSLTNSVSSKREIKLSTASHCFSNLIVIMVSRTISVANSSLA